MPRKPNTTRQAVRLIEAFVRLPTRHKILIVCLVAVGLVIWFLVNRPEPPPPAPPAGTDGYLFCFWNVENLFDDTDDRRGSVDETYDGPFAHDPELRRLKYDRIADALLRMNDGRGPDVIACCEVESVRAAELLRDALNARLDPALRYGYLAMVNVAAGRHIAPCLISRIPVAAGRTRLPVRQLRILEAGLTANGDDLTVIVSHWRSRVPDRETGGHGEEGRERYAATIRGLVDRLTEVEPTADILVCGDFNDEPADDSVRNVLRATGDRDRVAAGTSPWLLNLMAGKPPDRFGTHWYGGDPLIYDHICLSPGMLDGAGWWCDPDSIRTVRDGLVRSGATRPEPWKFGNPKSPPTGGRGYSDHFPVTVRLRVRPAGG